MYYAANGPKSGGCWICVCTPAKRAYKHTPARGASPLGPPETQMPRSCRHGEDTDTRMETQGRIFERQN